MTEYERGVRDERLRAIKIAQEIMHEGDWIAANIADPNYVPEDQDIPEWRRIVIPRPAPR